MSMFFRCFLCENCKNKSGNIRKAPAFFSVSECSPKPFESNGSDKHGSSFFISRPNVKRPAKPHAQTERGNTVCVFIYPFFLLGKAEADEKDIG